MEENKKLVVFEYKNIRRVWHNTEWYFSVVDVVSALTDSTLPRRYWSDLKSHLIGEGFELYEKIVQLKLPASDGKTYETDCANTEITDHFADVSKMVKNNVKDHVPGTRSMVDTVWRGSTPKHLNMYIPP